MRSRRAASGRGSPLASSMLALILILLAPRAWAADPKFPALTGRVVDDASILNPSTISEIDEMLAQHERTSGEQVVVVTLSSLQGHTIEDYGYQLGRFWGIGQKGKNNGAILIVAPNERKVRIEVGYGLEGQLTDAISRVIIESTILPQFRSGDFNAGVLAGTGAVLRALGDDAAANLHSEPAGKPVGQASDEHPTPFSPIFLLIFFVIVFFVMVRRSRHPYLMRHGGGYLGSGGFGGGSSGGGGFSGGGGSFGGGGASGGW